ncbi:tRNA uridine-5-carboxymethylaminomethyl(34) synthesis GTPase MnmE [Candidatus Enterovibrio escicola]|uniref:tRNA modification GTPase MnmE n=2 Tax=Candidatus Enterovibrio escicola TaxID=1927127 RepID=A0A2A5T591_9GAMM|nr:tRNA uridine-5-carboxymethylaminomethyl(34) synthesis GTPase MnmE [Candidatus Enterovibrio escacola]PCS23280.1 GTPase and tRNA-U34 5-formylation enzyme TrmE [Candidatus Enterovibrio escacola]
MIQTDTIVAQATPLGRSGIGIIRVSGPKAKDVTRAITGQDLPVRHATYLTFKDEEGTPLDQGIALFFQAPNSFTGEDVLELQGHGGPVIMDMLIKRIIAIDSVRTARPGEFSERAFLNEKLDLTQAEAIADLIDASSEQAARNALRSLQGTFSKKVKQLVESLISIRIYVEASIDFPDEEIDYLSDAKVATDLDDIINTLNEVRKEANQGTIMREGMKIVIVGRPNAGKSSLLNALSGKESAIVTHIAGTTRDILREQIHIDGMPLHLIDTAGLRVASNDIEIIGIERAWNEISQADRMLLVVDGTTTDATLPEEIWPEFIDRFPTRIGMTVIRNKADVTGETLGISKTNQMTLIRLSAKTGNGINTLREHLKACMGFSGSTEGSFMARRRHLEAIDDAAYHLKIGKEQFEDNAAREILAEELRIAQQHLSQIIGKFTSDDLLGRIFSSFCIGK